MNILRKLPKEIITLVAGTLLLIGGIVGGIV